MGRFGQPHEVAAATEFLLWDHAGFITGQALFTNRRALIGQALLEVNNTTTGRAHS